MKEVNAYIETIKEEMNCHTVFTIGGVGIKESVVATLIISLMLLVIGLVLTSGLKVENPSRRQLAMESFVLWLEGFFGNILGERGRRYAPYMMTIACYVAIANIFDIFGMKPPTKDMNCTAALALMSIVLVQYASIRARGVKGWLHSFLEPMPAMLPMNILELFIKPVSLCMRLFGNVLGAFVVICLVQGLTKFILPVPFTIYFDFFDGLIQVYVFTFLSSIYIAEAVE